MKKAKPKTIQLLVLWDDTVRPKGWVIKKNGKRVWPHAWAQRKSVPASIALSFRIVGCKNRLRAVRSAREMGRGLWANGHPAELRVINKGNKRISAVESSYGCDSKQRKG
jgi:hypothetical protein